MTNVEFLCFCRFLWVLSRGMTDHFLWSRGTCGYLENRKMFREPARCIQRSGGKCKNSTNYYSTY